MAQKQCPVCRNVYDDSKNSTCPRCSVEGLWDGVG